MDTSSLAELINLSGKTAVVTGGAMGIGRGIARRLHEAGANVVIADIDETAAHKTSDELSENRPNSSYVVVVDVAKSDDVKRVIEAAVEHFGSLDILVNNAGIFPFLPLAQMEEADFARVLDTNLRSVFLFTKFGSQQMIAQGGGGKIINVASIDSLHPSAIGLAAYDASKHGVWGFTKNTALELAKEKIWVNAIAPGGVLTPGVEKLSGGQVVPSTSTTIPMGRLGDPDEMGRVALFLASELSSYMTGSVVVADGGSLLT